jgi:hypothetical protein
MELMEVETLEHSIQRCFAETEQAGTLFPPNTFLIGDDTNIPALREFVHETTAVFHLSFAKTYYISCYSQQNDYNM